MPPVPHEQWFHVEHSPVQKTPSRTGRAVKNRKCIAIKELYRQLPGQLCRTASSLAPYFYFLPALSILSDPELNAVIQRAGKHSVLLAMRDERASNAGAKRPCQSQQVNTLEQAGFATAILTIKDVDAWPRAQDLFTKVAQMVDR